MNKKQTVLAGIVGLAVVSGAVLAYAPSADALTCSILPQQICDASHESNLEDSGTWMLLLLAVNILTAGVGIVAVGAIVYAGFLYTTAQSNAQQTKQAIEMIRNTVVGIVVYALMYVGVNFLIPGGVFTGPGSSSAPTSVLASLPYLPQEVRR